MLDWSLGSKDVLPAVEVYADTRFEISAPMTFQWEGYGFRIQLPEVVSTSFTIKAVWSDKFELPEGTELVSPVYWVSCEKKVGRLVGVDLQHCARVREEGQQSGLSFAVCKVEKAEPPYKFKLCEGRFSSRHNYGRTEVEISSTFLAIIRRVRSEGREQPTADPMFLAKLYYERQQLSTTTAHIMIVPQLDMSTTVGAWVYECMFHSRYMVVLKPQTSTDAGAEVRGQS